MNEATFVTPKEKKQFETKKERFKLFLTLLLTNICTLMICTMQMTPIEVEPTPAVELVQDHLWVTGALSLYLPFTEKTLTAVTLINQKGEVIIEKAYLYEKIQRDSSDSWEAAGEGLFYKVQIPTHQIEHFIQNIHQGLAAYPFHQKTEVQTSEIHKKIRRPYEVHF